MINYEKKILDTNLFKTLYIIALAFFMLMCAVSTNMLFSRKVNFIFFAVVAAVYLSAIVGLSIHVTKKSDAAKLRFYSLTSAFLCTYSFQLYFYNNTEKSLIWLIIFAFCAMFFSKALRYNTGRTVSIVSFGLGIIFAAFVWAGAQLKSSGYLELFYFGDDIYMLFYLLLMFAGEALFFAVTLNMMFCLILEKDYSARSNACRRADRVVYILVNMAAILLFWIPYYIALYPGNLNSDSVNELMQQTGKLPLSNHHPYMHQLLIRLSLELAGGEMQAGVGVYSTLQMLLVSFSFAVCIYALRKFEVNRYIQTAAFAFFALFPVNPIFSMTMWKDVPFAAICLLFCVILLFEAKFEEQSKGRRLLNCGLMIGLGVLFSTCRNNGWYAFLLGFPLYILFNREKWKRLLPIFVSVIILVSAYNHVIYDVIGVKKSSSGEALSIPLQQIARTVKLNPEVMDSEPIHILGEVFFDIETLGEKYDPTLSDPVKSPETFRADVFDEAPARYMKAWARLGLRYPVSYIEAFLMQNYGYWYPDVTYVIVNTAVNPNEFGIEHRGEFDVMRNELVRNYYVISKMRPIAIIFSLGLMVWLVMIAAALLCLKGQWKLASPICLLAMLWLTTLASPVYCEYRYLYGLVVSVPLFLGLALGVRNKSALTE